MEKKPRRKKGCLGKDGKYSLANCEEHNVQGIGRESEQSVATINHVVTERVISESRG
jgi:hypothetical protein